jgi:hypothetical protein
LKFVDLVGSKVRVNLSASEIVKLANQIIAKSNEVHNSVASVPLDKVLSICFFNSSLILLFLFIFAELQIHNKQVFYLQNDF